MSAKTFLTRRLPQGPWLTVGSYIAVLVICSMLSLFSLLELAERYREWNASLETLASLQKSVSSARSDAETWPAGSPLLEGETATTANAGLLQRITRTITGLGGNVLSSEVEPQRPQPNDYYLKITVNVEIEQSALQQLLYDIESGMPFLFIDRINVQNQATSSESGRLRVMLKASGLWLGKV